MMRFSKFIGIDYENIAVNYLRKKGYIILDRNFLFKGGEIDIIARDKNILVFVEVKYRENDELGHPLEAVTLEKQRKIVRTAELYIAKHNLYDKEARFDVVAILGDEIELIKNAFAMN